MDAMNDIQKIRTQIEQHQAEQEQVLRRTMSVLEMRKLLGLKKTESYWLIHRKFFRTETIGGTDYPLYIKPERRNALFPHSQLSIGGRGFHLTGDRHQA